MRRMGAEVARFRVHPKVKREYIRAAEEDGRTLSSWLRWLADRRLRELRAETPREP